MPSPDARLLASAMRGPNSDLGLWEIVTGKEIFLLKGQQELVEAIAWSPDGRFLATGDKRSHLMRPSVNQSIRLWDMVSGKEVAHFGDIKTDVTALTFAPDGKYLVAGLGDGTILIFEIAKTIPNMLPTPKFTKDELESRWNDLAAANAGRAHAAIWTLIAEPSLSVPFLLNRLKPIDPANASKIQQLIADLDSEKFAVRQEAAKELEKIGAQVIGPIQKTLMGNISLEKFRRLEQIVSKVSDVPSPETLRTLRAIMALERIGSPDAQAVLETLAGGAPGARETEEAKASLERLKHRVAKVP